jgi:hypothetical protein
MSRRRLHAVFGPVRAIILVLAALACVGDPTGSPTGPGTPTNGMSPTAFAYVEQVVNVMQANSIKRLSIDWTTFRTRVRTAAANAQTVGDTYSAITTALGLLGDGHSQFRTIGGTTLFVPTRSCPSSGATTPTLPNNIGYVRVGSFSGSGAAVTVFTQTLHETIRAADRADLIGWIVDLRGNGGGNMWPMIAGLGPILGDGVLGYFIDPTGAQSTWSYHDGASWLNGSALAQAEQPYRLINGNPRVAVLTDHAVASSGEATAIAFRGRPNTRTFGLATCGLSTANQSYTMSDGATLILTVSVMADRARLAYGDVLQPDETLVNQTQTVERAISWLQNPVP